MRFHSALLVLSVFSAAATAADALPSNHPAMDTKMPVLSAPAAPLPQKGKVLNAIDVPNYTYIEVAQNEKTFWIAGPNVAVEKGDMIRFNDGTVMTNFPSKVLKRSFPSITFVSEVVVTKEQD